MTILITNGANTHPPETWAMATAQLIFDVSQDYNGSNRIQALKFQAALAEALVAHHANVQSTEQALLDADIGRLAADHDPEQFIEAALADIRAQAASTPWADLFAGDDMADRIRGVLGSHFATAQHVHRQAHARANGELSASRAFLESLSGSEV